MRILGMVAENYKRLRLVEVAPDGRLVMFTGKPDQGKTSCVDAFLSAIGGKRFTQEMPVRKGAKRAELKLLLGSSRVEWTVRRTIRPDGTHDLVLTDASGRTQGRGQSILDELHGDIWMDPTEFVRMKPKEQVEILRKVAKLEIDVDALNAANKADFDERTAVGREVRRLEAELGSMAVHPDLPAEKVDESQILTALADVGSQNEEARRVDAEKQNLRNALREALAAVEWATTEHQQHLTHIAALEAQLQAAKTAAAAAKERITEAEEQARETQEMVKDAPDGVYADVTALTEQLQEAQLINREIEKRDRREAKEQELDTKRREYESLTRAMEAREEAKADALAAAKMPVEGLTFDEEQVLMRGIPLQQLGESEQIRICTRIAMAENPTLRVLPILHGESLGESGLAMLAAMAEEFDFQILMAMVDESGKRGYVIEDGTIVSEHSATPAEEKNT